MARFQILEKISCTTAGGVPPRARLLFCCGYWGRVQRAHGFSATYHPRNVRSTEQPRQQPAGCCWQEAAAVPATVPFTRPRYQLL
jgi:hypothetical protein